MYKEFLEMVLTIFGAFIATLFGVFLSLRYTKKHEKEKESDLNQKILLGSLKLIYSELDFNTKIIDNVIEGLRSMPRSAGLLYDNYNLLIHESNSTKYQCFYGTISSGNMNVISQHEDIFNALQQAYYNLELTMKGLILSQEVYKDFKGIKEDAIHPEIVGRLYVILDDELTKATYAREYVMLAKGKLSDYLSSYGITFKDESNL